MNRRLLLFVLTVLAMSSFTFAQTIEEASSMEDLQGHKIPKSLLNEISVNFVDEPLELALADISQKGNVRLNFTHENLPLDKKVTIEKDDAYVVEVLLAILDQTSTALTITQNGSIVIVPGSGAKESVENGRIAGVVLDVKTGETLPGANVWLEGTSKGSATNSKGEFIILNIAPGEYTVKSNYIGYEDYSAKVVVKPGEKTNLLVELSYSGAIEGEEIVVQAQASGQMQAINQQLSARELKSVVSKDRIRQLPNSNAAESVGRLPGVSLERSGGEGYGVVIRGLQPKYSKIMVDGVALEATGSNDRSVSMSSISSYSLEGIEVIKAPTADMDGDQVGGSVNMVMRTAPEGFKAEVIAEGGYVGMRNQYSGYNFVGTVSNRFVENKLGVFAQIVADGKDMGRNEMWAGYDRKSESNAAIKPLLTREITLSDDYVYRNRLGGTLTLDYLIPDGKIFFKNFFSSSKTSSQLFNENYKTSEHYFNATDRDYERIMVANVLGYNQYLSIFKVNAKLSHSYTGGETPNDISFRFKSPNDMKMFPGDTPPEEVPSYAKNIMEDFVWQYAYDNTSKTEGRQIAGQLDLETDFSLMKQLSGKIKFGGKFILNDRSYDLEKYRASITYAGSDYVLPLNEGIEQFKDLPKETRQHSYDLFIDKSFDHGDFLNGEFKMGPVADIGMMHDIIDLLRDIHQEVGDNTVNGYNYLDYSSHISDYTGDEQLGAGYLMAVLDITKKLTFIPGVRYEAKKTTYNGVWGYSDGLVEDKFNSTDTTAVRNNDFWLPMIHLKYEPTDWLQIRAAYTKTVARPNYNSLIPNMSISTRWKSLNMRNTQIRPELAESYDISFAISNNYLGLFTASGFWKNIDDMIFHFSDKVIIDPEEEGFDPKYKGYRYSADMNNETTSISKGFELDWQTNFWYLPSVLKGLVLNLNFTKIYSEALYPNYKVEQVGNFPYTRDSLIDISYTNRLVGQADEIANFAIGWDYKDFSVRVSMNYTTDIFRGHSFYPTYRRYTDAITLWDLRLKQKLPYNLQVYCNVSNLTNATERTHYKLGYPSTYNYYGSRIALGVIWGFGND